MELTQPRLSSGARGAYLASVRIARVGSVLWLVTCLGMPSCDAGSESPQPTVTPEQAQPSPNELPDSGAPPHDAAVSPDASPSASDGVQNGNETDIDCGGTGNPKCGTGKACAQASDCESAACPGQRCLSARSCRQHAGGETCGPGELGEAGAMHEDCCLSIRVEPEGTEAELLAAGLPSRPYRLDKYLITAGRLRVFLEDVRSWNQKRGRAAEPDVLAWAEANLTTWFHENVAEGMLPESWRASLPRDEAHLVALLNGATNVGASWEGGAPVGCYPAGGGKPTFWFSPDQLATIGADARADSREELDAKVLNCAPAALLAAFCAYDGARLPSHAEWLYAVRGRTPRAAHLFPWGSPPEGLTYATVTSYLQARASFSQNRFHPTCVGTADRACEVMAPGRFAEGAGPLHHADLLGLVETIVWSSPRNAPSAAPGFQMLRQYAYQENIYYVRQPEASPDDPIGYAQHAAYGTLAYNLVDKPFAAHSAIGARCAR